MLIHILKLSPPAAVVVFSEVSQEAQRLATDKGLWRALYRQGMGVRELEEGASPQVELSNELDDTWYFLSQPHLAKLVTKHFPNGRSDLKTTFYSSSPEGKALRLLAEMTSHYKKLNTYPQPARMLFRAFLNSINESFPMHGEEKETALLKKHHERLLLILEFCDLRESAVDRIDGLNLLDEFLYLVMHFYNIPKDETPLIVALYGESQYLRYSTLDDEEIYRLRDQYFIDACIKMRSPDSIESDLYWKKLDDNLEDANTIKLLGLPEFSTPDKIIAAATQWVTQKQSTQERILNLDRKGLTRLPKLVTLVTSLETLSLVHNYISSLPNEIATLTALKKFGIYNNRLISLPAEIGKLRALGDLDFTGNNLTYMIREIGELTALTVLSFTDNNLHFLPKEIGHLTALEHFALLRNNLCSLNTK